MPTPQNGIEVYSAIHDDPNILEACRVVGIRGACDTCRFATDRLHAPSVVHGIFCDAHCPVCCGAVTISEAEREAMERNVARLSSRERVAFMMRQESEEREREQAAEEQRLRMSEQWKDPAWASQRRERLKAGARKRFALVKANGPDASEERRRAGIKRATAARWKDPEERTRLVEGLTAGQRARREKERQERE